MTLADKEIGNIKFLVCLKKIIKSGYWLYKKMKVFLNDLSKSYYFTTYPIYAEWNFSPLLIGTVVYACICMSTYFTIYFTLSQETKLCPIWKFHLEEFPSPYEKII